MQFEWTVNWKFLPEDIFLGKPLALALLVATVAIWAALFLGKWPSVQTAMRAKRGAGGAGGAVLLDPAYVILTLFASSFVGVAFARSLHYQFYSWYFHQLPLLLWSSPRLPLLVKLASLAAVEYAFNVYPATPASSAWLQVAHGATLASVVLAQVPGPLAREAPHSKRDKES